MTAPQMVVVVTDPKDLPPSDLHVVRAETYLAAGEEYGRPGTTVVNLCRTWRYLSRGYYVSLLADARGQTALPAVRTLEGIPNPRAVFRVLKEAGIETLDERELAMRLHLAPQPESPDKDKDDEDVIPLVREMRDEIDLPLFHPPKPDELAEVLVCLGKTEVPGFRRLAARVYRALPTPVLRMRLVKDENRWKLYHLVNEKINRLTDAEKAQLLRALQTPPAAVSEPRKSTKPTLAILYDETDRYKGSTPETVERLERVAARRGLRTERITLDDIDRLGEFDALFIRVLTGLDQPSFRFATRAEAMDIPVIDDPTSIIRSSNKVFLYELLSRDGLPVPRTVVFGREMGFEELKAALGIPYVVKLPDGSFSAAVHRIETAEEHTARVGDMLRRSPLLVAQEYVPTPFDWRVTVLDGKPLFVCRYHMAPGHWQIRNVTSAGVRYGRVESIARDKAPPDVVRLGCRAARLVGDGMYGVDLKQTDRGAVVIEVNDNPNLDTGYDDAADGDVIYEDIISWFEKRMDTEDRKDREKDRERTRQPAATNGALEALRKPIGKAGAGASGPFRAWEVVGIELEYPVVDRDLNCISAVEEAISELAGHPSSDAELGMVAFSNEIMDHVLEIKTPLPLRSLARSEEYLVEGVRRMSMLLAARLDARLLPCGMHPWFNPKNARLWRRSNRRIYDTYARLFDVHTHGWANVQASHVNLPMGTEEEAVDMMNAAALVVPYLPALAASSPMFEGDLQPAADNRLAFIIEHQLRLPESSGQIVPEPIRNIRGYKRNILGKMYAALDKLPDAGAIRHEFLNARGAVFKFSREAMEVRVLDVQECVHMDVAIAAFTRRALKAIAVELEDERIDIPEHAILVEDFRAVVRHGTAARVRAPHLALDAERDDEGRVDVKAVLWDLMKRANHRPPKEEVGYLEDVAAIIENGNLSECIGRALQPYVQASDDAFTDAARRIWIRLAECLVENKPWEGRVRA